MRTSSPHQSSEANYSRSAPALDIYKSRDGTDQSASPANTFRIANTGTDELSASILPSQDVPVAPNQVTFSPVNSNNTQMVLKIRLARLGFRNKPFYNIVVAQSRFAIHLTP